MKISSLKIVITLWISLLIVSACGSKTDVMANADAKKAEKIIAELHDLMGKHKYEETHDLFSESFKEVNSWKQIHVVYDSAMKLGEIKQKSVTTSESTLGAKDKINYNLIFDVKRTKINSTEQYHLVQDGEEIKINSFKILAVPYIE